MTAEHQGAGHPDADPRQGSQAPGSAGNAQQPRTFAGDTLVTATAMGPWPGTDPAEAARTVRGELGEPHLPHLVELPGRGAGSDAVGRTAAMLLELPVDLQPYGWRLVDRPGRDRQRAVSALSTDVNVLADLIGAEENPGDQLKLQVRGPLSMAANLYLHHGERALLDAGARREIAQSLAAGAADHIARVAANARGAAIVLQVDEPELTAVLAGSIPTASGYRTLRAVPVAEAAAAWRLLAEAARDAGAVRVVASAPASDALFDAAARGGLDGVAVPLAGLTVPLWERVAAAAEDGQRTWLGVIGTASPQAALPQVTALVDAVTRPWRQLGLELSLLHRLRLTPEGGLAAHTPRQARDVLKRLTQTADALNQLSAEH